ncbi:CRISPR-associated endonuclease Cas2 [Crenalkalicoccus roseus]|uniref:CRISPR-associated endonuclease Cas2 n=1 Tax=Crenalkalicoccus roseus TaxID=1485588 RepID=UPI001080E316|nr:CRISPR-associated endonuclease Cas2 [Crenalkalicoccus roseus]
MGRRRTWLIGYDIASPRRLRRVARLLEKRAYRLQYSLFVACWTEAEFASVWAALAELIHPRRDDVRAWPLAENAQVEVWGMSWPADVLVGEGRSRPFGRLLGQRGVAEPDDAVYPDPDLEG